MLFDHTTIDPFYFSEPWKELRAAVLKRDGGICVYCGCVGVQADHVIPRRKGGADALENLVCCCPRCNLVLGGNVFPSFDDKKTWLLSELKRIKDKHDAKRIAQCSPERCGYKRISKTRGCTNPAKPGSVYCTLHHQVVIEKRTQKDTIGKRRKCEFRSPYGDACPAKATVKKGKRYFCDTHKRS